MNESFLRDFFRMPAASKPEPAQTNAKQRTISIECVASDPIEVRAENIVKMLGFHGSGSGYSIPQISPAEATVRVIKVLRKYAEQDGKIL